MAIFASIFAAAGRFLGRFLNTALGWATILLFGQVPESRRLLLSLITLGSMVWVAVLVGVLVPDVGAFLVAAVPAPEGFELWVSLGMVVAAVVLPLVIGVGGLLIQDPDQRPKGLALVKQVLRGYLYTPVLAGVLAFLFVEAPLRRLRALIKRWETAHVPLIVKPSGYDTVAAALHDALRAAGLDLRTRRAPRALTLPAKALAWAGGTGVGGLVPDHLAMMSAHDLEILVYPSDVSILGKPETVSRARAAIASRLPFTAAYLTAGKEGQRIEDRLAAIAGRLESVRHVSRATATATADGADSETAGSADAASARSAMGGSVDAAIAASDGDTGAAIDQAIRDVQEVDQELASLVISWDEWEVLYRVRLQVERDLRAAHDLVEAAAGDGDAAAFPAADGAEHPGRHGQGGLVGRIVARFRQLLDRLHQGMASSSGPPPEA
ncbi:MAG: hypothetical protein M3395_03070 [Chloroflexota bacterium]|nr:hypothetical protein [Chloroflexota bacterium]